MPFTPLASKFRLPIGLWCIGENASFHVGAAEWILLDLCPINKLSRLLTCNFSGQLMLVLWGEFSIKSTVARMIEWTNQNTSPLEIILAPCWNKITGKLFYCPCHFYPLYMPHLYSYLFYSYRLMVFFCTFGAVNVMILLRMEENLVL